MSETKPFEFDANKYTQAAAHQREWGSRLIAELSLRGDEHILDLGCGDGVVTAKLAELVPNGRVVGIDSSQNMIDSAQSRAGNRLSFRRLDINELDYCDAFDLVFSNATLHWVHDHRRLLVNVDRALKPRGACRFNFAGAGNCSHLNGVVRELIRDPRYERFFRGFEWPWFMPAIDEYEFFLIASPFADHRVWGEIADRYFADAAAMTAWLDQPSLVPFLRQLDGTEKQAFRDEVVAKLLELTRQPDGTQFETFRRINVVARK